MCAIRKSELPDSVRRAAGQPGSLSALAAELDRVLALGPYMGGGTLFVFYYFDELAITNARGFRDWPQGSRRMVGIIHPMDRREGLSQQKYNALLARAWELRPRKDKAA